MRIYEINARLHCPAFDLITDDELHELSQLGFDAVWMMGVWRISEGARKISKITSEDFDGSPYAVPAYEINRELGGSSQFKRLVKRAHAVGLSVIVDFVSNHMALDSPWINERPDLFILSDPKARTQSTSEFFLHRSNEIVAFGRDPYFAPWNDTAQLNYANETLRKRMIEVLIRISRYADGVRCDMAMLVLRDCIRRLWYPLTPDSLFDQMMPGEFWDQAIADVRKISPDFKFIAEAYWDKEHELRALGFDLCYEKKLYDALVGHDLVRGVQHERAAGRRGVGEDRRQVEPVGEMGVVPIAPPLARARGDRQQQGGDVDAAAELVAHAGRRGGQQRARVPDDQRDADRLLVGAGALAAKAVRGRVLAVIGGEHDHRVGGDVGL